VNLDLTLPEHAIKASPFDLHNMTPADKLILGGCLTSAYLSQMTIDQKAELNLPGHTPTYRGPIKYQGDDQIVKSFLGEKGEMVTRLEPNPLYKWYAVAKGINFSGVCRGSNNLLEVIPPGVKRLDFTPALSQYDAEQLWRKAKMMGRAKPAEVLIANGE
jgi:hypothetical protein